MNSVLRKLTAATLSLGLAVGMSGPYVKSAQAATAVLQIEEEELGWVEPKVVRRLVALELADVKVPPAPGVRPRAQAPGLFVRILRYQTQMVVEVWERGDLVGQRRLTIAGSVQVRARRVALAVGELARRLREQRIADERRFRRKLAKEAQEAALRRGVPLYAVLGVSSSLRGVMTGAGDSVWLGPQVTASLSAASGPLLALSGSVLFGETPRIGALQSAEWWEVGLHPGYAFRLGPTTRLAVSLNAAAAILHVNGAVRLDSAVRLDGAVRQTWSARGGAEATLQLKLSRTTELELGPELGVLLRRVSAEQSDARGYLGGVWTGVRVGIKLTPSGAW